MFDFTRYILRHNIPAAAVICSGNVTESIDDCQQGNVRLLNAIRSQVSMQGIVEICDNGQWVGIYSTYWSNRHTRLACQELFGKLPKGKDFLVSLKENTYYIDLCSVLDTELHGNGSIQSFNWLAILPKKC